MAKKNTKIFKRLIYFLKLTFGFGLFGGLLIWNDNFRNLIDIFKSIEPIFVVILLFLGIALNWISCLKWRLFLERQGFEIGMYRLLGLYFIGKFFNNFIPSMVGGDLTRTYLLGRQINSQSKSFASVFLERFTGLIALIVLVLIFSAFNLQMLKEPKIGILIIAIVITLIM